VMPIPGPVPAFTPGGWHPTGSRGVVSLPKDQLEAIANGEALRTVRRVWLLRLGAGTYDRGDVFLLALNHKRRATDHLIDGPIDIIGMELR
jgi:mannosyltransferase